VADWSDRQTVPALFALVAQRTRSMRNALDDKRAKKKLLKSAF